MSEETKDKKDQKTTEEPKKEADSTVQINKPTEVLPINSDPVVKDVPPVVPTPSSPQAEKPLVVSEAEVKQVSSTVDSGNNVNDEIEVLTGEIQSLEAKIDRLSGSVETPAAPEMPVNQPAPIEPIAPPPSVLTEQKPEISQEMPAKQEEKVTFNDNIEPAKKPEMAKGVNDIYQKVTDKQQKAEEKENPTDDGIQEGTSFTEILGTVSDVISVFGVIVFLVLMLSPFYKNYLSTGIIDAIKSIGWLSAGGCLGVALLLSLPTKGKWTIKIMLLVFLILVALMWLGINKNSLLDPLEAYLGTLFGYYR